MTRLKAAAALFNAHRNDIIKAIVIEFLLSLIISAGLGLLSNISRPNLLGLVCVGVLGFLAAWANTTFILNLVRNICCNLRFEPALSKAMKNLWPNMRKDGIAFVLYTILLSCGLGLVVWLFITLLAPSAMVFYMRLQYALMQNPVLSVLIAILSSLAIYVLVFFVLVIVNFIQCLTLHKEEMAIEGKIVQPISYDLAYALIPAAASTLFLLAVALVTAFFSYLFGGRPFIPGFFTTLILSLVLEIIETSLMVNFILVLNTSKTIWNQAVSKKQKTPPVILPATPKGHSDKTASENP